MDSQEIQQKFEIRTHKDFKPCASMFTGLVITTLNKKPLCPSRPIIINRGIFFVNHPQNLQQNFQHGTFMT